MILNMHVLCTGNSCVANENVPLTMVRWTIKVLYYYYYFIYCIIIIVLLLLYYYYCIIIRAGSNYVIVQQLSIVISHYVDN